MSSIAQTRAAAVAMRVPLPPRPFGARWAQVPVCGTVASPGLNRGAGDGDLALVRPGAAEFSRRADQAGPGVGVYEQLGNGVCGHPAAVTGDDLGDGGGFAVDGDLARPGEGGAAALAGLCKGTLVLGKDLGCQRALHA